MKVTNYVLPPNPDAYKTTPNTTEANGVNKGATSADNDKAAG